MILSYNQLFCIVVRYGAPLQNFLEIICWLTSTNVMNTMFVIVLNIRLAMYSLCILGVYSIETGEKERV